MFFPQVQAIHKDLQYGPAPVDTLDVIFPGSSSYIDMAAALDKQPCGRLNIRSTGDYMARYRKGWRKPTVISRRKMPVLLLLLLFLLCIFITGYGLRLLRTQLLIKDILKSGINYDAFRSMQVTEEEMKQAEAGIQKVIRRYPQLKSYSYMDPIGYLTFFMVINEFHPENGVRPDAKLYVRVVTELSHISWFQELYSGYQAALSGLRFFPVPTVTGGEADITYEDSWFVHRSYGGNRRHEGTDLMASNNIRGYFPVISITDGSIEKLGWLEQGGYRIGIRTKSGGYFYYAHLASYAPGLSAGTPVIAGQLLGFMGDSGYGPEGTIGKFDVHLHLGIYVPTKNGDMSINPYYILKILEKNRTQIN